VRNATLHATLEAFAVDAAARLARETADGAEVPFEVVETAGRRGHAALYCYRPLTGTFIGERDFLLWRLETYAPAARSLAALPGVSRYLELRGEPRVPSDERERADAALRCFLSAVFAERSQFAVEAAQFEGAYQELEQAVYEGRSITTVIAPVLGVALDHTTKDLALGEGVSLVGGESLLAGDSLSDVPPDAVWSGGAEPNVVAVVTVTDEPSDRSAIAIARTRLRRLLTALRLFERGGYALGPIAWARNDSGPWRAVPLGLTGRPRLVTLIRAPQEDELRAFCNLTARRQPGGELAWALARFEMGHERRSPLEALSDYLLALRALLEPEGPASGRLVQRLAVICAKPEARAAAAERTAQAVSLERAVVAGTAPSDPGAQALVGELGEHLRTLLRDTLCGHLDADLVRVADGLLSDASTEEAAAAQPRRRSARGARGRLAPHATTSAISRSRSSGDANR